MNVTNEIFNVLWEHRGGSFGEPGDVYEEFLYSALTECRPLGLIQAYIPPLNDAQLGDWTELEYWLQDIDPGFEISDLLLFSSKVIDFDRSTPAEVLGSTADIFQVAINLVKRSGDLLSGREIWATEINYENKKLFLLYSDLDGWALGHSYAVKILESLDTLSEENGYFQTD